MGVHRLDTPRKLNAQNRKEWRLLFEEFKSTELFKRSPSLSIFVVFQDWVEENYNSPSKRMICK